MYIINSYLVPVSPKLYNNNLLWRSSRLLPIRDKHVDDLLSIKLSYKRLPRTNKRTWILKYLQEGVNKLKMYLRILANPLVIKTCGIDSRSLCGHFKTQLRKIHRGNPTLEVIKLEKVAKILSILELANIILHCTNPFQNGFLERKSH